MKNVRIMIRFVNVLLAFLTAEIIVSNDDGNGSLVPFGEFFVFEKFGRRTFDFAAFGVDESVSRNHDACADFGARSHSWKGKKMISLIFLGFSLKKDEKLEEKCTLSRDRLVQLFQVMFQRTPLVEPQTASRTFVSSALFPPHDVPLHVQQIRVDVRGTRTAIDDKLNDL